MLSHHSPPISRRHILRSLGAGGAVLAAAACAPAATPAAPPPAAPVPNAPAPTPWQKDWDALVAAAKQEGKLALYSAPGAGYAKAVAAFEAAFPGIRVEHGQAKPGVAYFAYDTAENIARVAETYLVAQKILT